MKKLYLFITASVLLSCSLILQDNGKIDIPNGANKIVTIPYRIINYQMIKKSLTKSILDEIVEKTSSEAKRTCKYELTYIPISVLVYGSNDTIHASLDYSAESGFGVPQKLTIYSKFKGTSLISTLPPMQ